MGPTAAPGPLMLFKTLLSELQMLFPFLGGPKSQRASEKRTLAAVTLGTAWQRACIAPRC